jgi:hypothetical protein
MICVGSLNGARNPGACPFATIALLTNIVDGPTTQTMRPTIVTAYASAPSAGFSRGRAGAPVLGRDTVALSVARRILLGSLARSWRAQPQRYEAFGRTAGDLDQVVVPVLRQ